MNDSPLKQVANNPPPLELRDIHLPEPISWWPITAGWWFILVAIILVFISLLLVRKIRDSKQLKNEIHVELEHIKQQFQQSGNKIQLAKNLSILLRRASISYYPDTDFAGLTGEHWLKHLDETLNSSTETNKFLGKTGEVLLTAPYLPEETKLDFDGPALISLCESWLMANHKHQGRKTDTRGRSA